MKMEWRKFSKHKLKKMECLNKCWKSPEDKSCESTNLQGFIISFTAKPFYRSRWSAVPIRRTQRTHSCIPTGERRRERPLPIFFLFLSCSPSVYQGNLKFARSDLGLRLGFDSTCPDPMFISAKFFLILI